MAFRATNRTSLPKALGNIDKDDLNSNQQAIPVPYVAGRNRIPVTWISPCYIQASTSTHYRLVDCSFIGGWNQVSLANGFARHVRGCHFLEFLCYGLELSHDLVPDSGDDEVNGCYLGTSSAAAGTTSACIHWPSASGLRLNSNKFNGGAGKRGQLWSLGRLEVRPRSDERLCDRRQQLRESRRQRHRRHLGRHARQQWAGAKSHCPRG